MSRRLPDLLLSTGAMTGPHRRASRISRALLLARRLMLDQDLIQHIKPSAGVVPVRWPYEPATDDHMRDDEVVDALEQPPRGPMTRLDLLVAVLCVLLALAPVVYVAGLW